jgi:hypothetical protein
MVMELIVACVPAPDKVMTVFGFAAVLVIVTVPDTVELPDGAKLTFIFAVCPGPKMLPADMPLALNPGPEMLMFEIAMLALPAFVRVNPNTPLLPILTLPKARFDALLISCDVPLLPCDVALFTCEEVSATCDAPSVVACDVGDWGGVSDVVSSLKVD